MTTAIEETYEDVEKLVHHLTHKFLRRKGISEYDYEEWHGEANQAFCSSYSSYDPGKSQFTTHLWHRVWHALADKLQRDAPHWKTEHYDWEGSREIVDESTISEFNGDFVMSLSEDARVVVKLVLGAGGHVDGKKSNPGDIRVGLYSLLTNFGWSFRRIVEAFHEIKTVLLN